jgi:hypothetical protein
VRRRKCGTGAARLQGHENVGRDMARYCGSRQGAVNQLVDGGGDKTLGEDDDDLYFGFGKKKRRRTSWG